jgi:hypothetical protein
VSFPAFRDDERYKPDGVFLAKYIVRHELDTYAKQHTCLPAMVVAGCAGGRGDGGVDPGGLTPAFLGPRLVVHDSPRDRRVASVYFVSSRLNIRGPFFLSRPPRTVSACARLRLCNLTYLITLQLKRSTHYSRDRQLPNRARRRRRRGWIDSRKRLYTVV